MDERWQRGIAILAGGLGAVLVVTLIFAFFDIDDRGLLVTFVAMMSGSFAIDLYVRLKARFGDGKSNIET